MRTVIISQARMTSTRLPGKVLKEVCGKRLLEHHIERLQRCKLADEVIVATTTNRSDDPIVALCDSLGIAVFRGSEEDVLARYFGAAQNSGADVVVRVTSDCPLIDPGVVDEIIHTYATNYNDFDYVSNTLERTFPRGMDAEIFSFRALDAANSQAVDMSDREHVTPFIWRQPDRFRIHSFVQDKNESQFRLTVDTPEDFELIQWIINQLYPLIPNFSLGDIIKLLQDYPKMAQINAHVEQKKLGE